MNHKIIKVKVKGINPERIIKMGKMQPGQVGEIIDDQYKNHYVLRTYSISNFEVINLSEPRKNNCWTNKSCPLKVRILNPNESIVVEFKN